MCSERACQGHLLCKLSHSQLSEVQRKPIFDVIIKSMDNEIQVMGTGSRSMLEGHIKVNYYASFHTRSYD